MRGIKFILGSQGTVLEIPYEQNVLLKLEHAYKFASLTILRITIKINEVQNVLRAPVLLCLGSWMRPYVMYTRKASAYATKLQVCYYDIGNVKLSVYSSVNVND